ncbi:MAG: TlpA family protein disulfide reductase [Epsilonproteobacteria bacterium]|nr:MAG: TlpA family protein disulfide reductase [Campylobacterota bacterium]
MKKILTLTLLLASLLTVSQAAEDKFTMTTIKGKTIEVTGTTTGLILEEYKGKIIFLEFFGHRCPPCLKSIGHYKRLQEKYKDKLVIVAVEVQGMNRSSLKAFVKKKKINYVTISQDQAGQIVPYISSRAQWRGSIPYLIILDQKGEVQLMQAGMLPEQELENYIEQLSK